MEKSISFNSCSRLRQIQSLLVNKSLDGLLCVLGIDGHYNKGCLQLANYLLFNLFQDNQSTSMNCPEDYFDDIILLIKPNAVHIYCNPFNRTLLLPFISHWHNLCFHCLTPDKFEADQIAEDFKIKSFIAMVTGCDKIGVPYSDSVEPQPFNKFEVEKWPIVQAFANDDYNSGGFFTLIYEKQTKSEASILSLAKKALGMKKMQNPDSKCCSVLDISKDLVPLYETVDPAYLKILVTKHLSSFGNHWDTMMALTSLGLSSNGVQISESKVSEPLQSFYNHGKVKNSPQNGSSNPFVLFGNNATQKYIQNLSTVEAGTLENTGIHEGPAILMVCQEISPSFPLFCCRTYFFQNEPFRNKEKPQEVRAKNLRQIETVYLTLIDAVLQAIHVYKETENNKKAEEKAREVLQGCKNKLKNENLKKHLENRENILFILETISFSKTDLTKLDSGSAVKKIQMYIWDLPCMGKKCGSTYGSLSFGETFIISPIQIQENTNDDGSNCRNNEVLILTCNIPRYQCWRTNPIDDNIEEACKSLMLTDNFGKVLFDANTVDILAFNEQCDFLSSGNLYVFENGIVILHPIQDPICLLNSSIISMESYYEDSFSSLAFLLVKINPDQTDLPVNFNNSSGNFVIVFKPGSKARKVLFSQLLPYWRKYGQILHVDELEPSLQKKYTHLMKLETDTGSNSSMLGFKCEWTLKQANVHLPGLAKFFDHLLVSNVYKSPMPSDLLPILLKKWPKVTEEADDKVIITIISGIQGSHKEKVFKVLRTLSKDNNRWMILNNPIDETGPFNGANLQKYLSTSILSQRKNILGSENGDKKLRVIIIVPGYTETVDVVRAVLNHPDSQIREQIKIGAVTVCINPDNCFLENSFIFPPLLNQCATGWVNNVLFISTRNHESLINEIQVLIRSANPHVSFLKSQKGKFQGYDFDLILSESAFDSPTLRRARNLLHPNWRNPQVSNVALSEPFPIEDVKLEFSQPMQKHSLKLKLAGLKGNLGGFPFHKNIYNVRGQVIFTGETQLYTFHYITLSNQLEIEVGTLIPTPPKPSPQKEKPAAKYFVTFSGCRLDKEELKIWLRPCFKNIPQKKTLLNRKDLPQHIIRKVQDKHHLDSLPAGWFYNGMQYVCMTGERSTQHPDLDQFLDKYTEVTNQEINNFNAEVEKEKQRFVFF